MNFEGLIIGLATFTCIGLFHPLVIKAEYYLSEKCWWLFCLVGLICLTLSLFIHSTIGSTIAGVISCSCFWSIRELFQQRNRVEKGWFPKNPNRKTPYRKQ